MANYYETSKTNYFGVKDTTAFIELLKNNDIYYEVINTVELDVPPTIYINNGRVIIPPRRLLFIGNISGEPICIYDEECDDMIPFESYISNYLLPGEVCIYQFIGHEKLRDVSAGFMIIPANEDDVNKRITVDMRDVLFGFIGDLRIMSHNKII